MTKEKKLTEKGYKEAFSYLFDNKNYPYCYSDHEMTFNSEKELLSYETKCYNNWVEKNNENMEKLYFGIDERF